MKKVILTLSGPVVAGIVLFLFVSRNERLDERIVYPFATRHQTAAFVNHLLSTEPPGALVPPKELSEWETARSFYQQELARALGTDVLSFLHPNERRGDMVLHGRYRVTPLSFAALPGIRAAAAIYLPTAISPPFPAVIIAADKGSISSRTVRYLAATLAARGVAVLTLESPRAGSREKETGDETLLAAGFTPLSTLVAEQRQAIALLTTLPEISVSRIALLGIGSSALAGICTAALDERVAAVAALSATTSFQALAASGDTAELLILPHRSFSLHHLFALIAPRPFLLAPSEASLEQIVTHKDTIRRTGELYRFLGASDAFEVSGSCETTKLPALCRKDIYTFLAEHLAFPGVEEEEDDLPSAAELTLAPAHHAGMPITELGRREALIFRDAVRARRDETGPERYGQEIAEAIRDLSGAGLWGSPPPLAPIVHRATPDGETLTEIVSIVSDPGIRVPLSLSAPSRAPNIVIVISESALARTIAEDLVTEGTVVLEASLRHMEDDNLFDRFLRPVRGRRGAIAALVAGIPAAAHHSADILAMTAYLGERFGENISVGLYAEGPEATLAALLAAHRTDRIGWLVLNGIPVSLAPSETGDNALIRELAIRVPGILRHGDIADLVATLAPRRTLVTGLIGPAREAENEALFSSLLWEKRHVLIISGPDRTVIGRFLRTRGTTPAP